MIVFTAIDVVARPLPAGWGGRCGDATGSGKSDQQGEDGIVKHDCEDGIDAMNVLMAAEVALGLEDRRVERLPFYILVGIRKNLWLITLR